MNFLYSYNEVNLNFVYKSTLKRVDFLKNNKFNNNLSKPKLKLFVNFNNVTEPDFVKIYDYVLIMWLMTGRISFLKKLGQSLRRGVRYYRFMLFLNLYDDFRYYKFLEFMHYSLFNYVGKDNVNIFVNGINNFHIIVSNIIGFTNLKFFSSFYLIGVNNSIEITFFRKQNVCKNYFFSVKFFLSLFKINARDK